MGRAGSARHVTGCHFNQNCRLQNALDDVGSVIWQALPAARRGRHTDARVRAVTHTPQPVVWRRKLKLNANVDSSL